MSPPRDAPLRATSMAQQRRERRRVEGEGAQAPTVCSVCIRVDGVSPLAVQVTRCLRQGPGAKSQEKSRLHHTAGGRAGGSAARGSTIEGISGDYRWPSEVRGAPLPPPHSRRAAPDRRGPLVREARLGARAQQGAHPREDELGVPGPSSREKSVRNGCGLAMQQAACRTHRRSPIGDPPRRSRGRTAQGHWDFDAT